VRLQKARELAQRRTAQAPLAPAAAAVRRCLLPAACTRPPNGAALEADTDATAAKAACRAPAGMTGTPGKKQRASPSAPLATPITASPALKNGAYWVSHALGWG
jgi:hypothetical protein